MDTMKGKEEFKDCDFTDAYYQNTSILNMLMSKIGIPQRKSQIQRMLLSFPVTKKLSNS